MDFMDILMGGSMAVFLGLSILAAYRSSHAHTEMVQCYAKLIEKNILHHSPTATGAAIVEEDYELTFLLEDGKKRAFLVWPMVFDSVDCEEEGILQYKGNDLISFGEHIKEFHLND